MFRNEHFKARRQYSAFVCCLTATLLIGSLLVPQTANALYILTGTDDSAIVLDDGAKSVDFSNKLVYVGTDSNRQPELTLTAGQTVSIRYQDAELSVNSQAETVTALLNRIRIVPSPLEMVAVDVSQSPLRITVASDLTFYEKVTEPSSSPVERRANPDMAKGSEKVAQQGQDGMCTATYEVVYSNGREASRQLVEISDSTATPTLVEYGTKVVAVESADRIAQVFSEGNGSGTLSFQSGATLSYSKAMTMTATAYTAGHDGVGTRTATGTRVSRGTVAVDPKVIPLGSKLYIVTTSGIVYGQAVAADTGVRGNKVDLYYDTYTQCINFGRRPATVYILD